MDQDDLSHARHVRALAVWSWVGGTVLLVASVLLFVAGVASIDPEDPPGSEALKVGFMATGVAVTVGTLSIWTGFGLWTYRNWARLLFVLLVVLDLARLVFGMRVWIETALDEIQGVSWMLFAVQIAWDIACLWVVSGGHAACIFASGHHATTRVDWWRSIFFKIPLVAFAAAIVVGLGLATIA